MPRCSRGSGRKELIDPAPPPRSSPTQFCGPHSRNLKFEKLHFPSEALFPNPTRSVPLVFAPISLVTRLSLMTFSPSERLS